MFVTHVPIINRSLKVMFWPKTFGNSLSERIIQKIIALLGVAWFFPALQTPLRVCNELCAETVEIFLEAVAIWIT